MSLGAGATPGAVNTPSASHANDLEAKQLIRGGATPKAGSGTVSNPSLLHCNNLEAKQQFSGRFQTSQSWAGFDSIGRGRPQSSIGRKGPAPALEGIPAEAYEAYVARLPGASRDSQ